MKRPQDLATDRRLTDGCARFRWLATEAFLCMPAAYERHRVRNIVESTERSESYASAFAPLRCSATQPATCTRELKPSLVRMCSRWLSTVRSDRKRRSAIARLVIPEATNRATSNSRLLRPPARLAALPRRGPPGTSRANTSSWADDIARPGLSVEAALRNAPARRDNMIVVPKVVE